MNFNLQTGLILVLIIAVGVMIGQIVSHNYISKQEDKKLEDWMKGLLGGSNGGQVPQPVPTTDPIPTTM